MKSNFSKQQFAYKIEDYYAYLWFPTAILLWICLHLWNNHVNQQFLYVDQWVQKNGALQFFINDGNGYSQEKSLTSVISTDKTKTSLKLNITDYPVIETIRFDPINNNGSVVLSKLKLKKRGEWFAQSILEPEYEPSNAIRFQWNAKKSELEIYPDEHSNDPQFIITADFESIPEKSILLKKTATLTILLLVSLGINFILSRFWIACLSRILFILSVPIDGIKMASNRYTGWINRFSKKWSLVNPTSCVIAGVLMTIISFLFADQIDFFENESQHNQTYVKFDIQNGSCKTMHFLYSTGNGYDIEGSKYVNFDPSPLPYTVTIPLIPIEKPIEFVRMDPFEGEGQAIISNVRFMKNSGHIIPLNMKDWHTNDHLTVINQTEYMWELSSHGNDPYLISPELNLDVSNRTALPAKFVFCLAIWFLTSIALLAYNRLITEGMSYQDIQNLQQM